jgi:hypothetical protein
VYGGKGLISEVGGPCPPPVAPIDAKGKKCAAGKTVAAMSNAKIAAIVAADLDVWNPSEPLTMSSAWKVDRPSGFVGSFESFEVSKPMNINARLSRTEAKMMPTGIDYENGGRFIDGSCSAHALGR